MNIKSLLTTSGRRAGRRNLLATACRIDTSPAETSPADRRRARSPISSRRVGSPCDTPPGSPPPMTRRHPPMTRRVGRT